MPRPIGLYISHGIAIRKMAISHMSMAMSHVAIYIGVCLMS